MTFDTFASAARPSSIGRHTDVYPTLGGGTPLLTMMGDSISVFGTMIGVAGINGILGEYRTAAAINAVAGISGDLQYCRALDIQSYIYFNFQNTTAVRIFIGFSDQSGSNMVGSDSPSGNYAGLFYSTTLGNQLYFITSDGTTKIQHQLSQVDNNFHNLWVRLWRDLPGNAVCQLQIDDSIINDVFSAIPAITTPLRFIAFEKSLDGGAKNLQIGRVHIEQSC